MNGILLIAVANGTYQLTTTTCRSHPSDLRKSKSFTEQTSERKLAASERMENFFLMCAAHKKRNEGASKTN